MHALFGGHAREHSDVATAARTDGEVDEVHTVMHHAGDRHRRGGCLGPRDRHDRHVRPGGAEDGVRGARERHVVRGDDSQRREARRIRWTGQRVVVHHVALGEKLVRADGMLELDARPTHPHGVLYGHDGDALDRTGRVGMTDQQHRVTGNTEAAREQVHDGLGAAIRRRWDGQPRRCDHADPHAPSLAATRRRTRVTTDRIDARAPTRGLAFSRSRNDWAHWCTS